MQSNVLIDWLTFSSKIDTVYSILERLGLHENQFNPVSGRYYYAHAVRFGHITIYYDGMSPDMGICVEMSGQGCRDFETFGNGEWDSFFRYYIDNRDNINISRLDVAYDDFDRLLDLDLICADTFAGYYVSKNKHWNVQKGSRGLTVEHGDRGGSCYIRIYDKKAERKRSDLEYWARCEIQLRDKLPGNFVEALIKEHIDITVLYFQVLNNYIRYLKPSDTDSNKARWETADHWDRFIQSAEKRSIFIAPGVDYNMLGLQHYVIDTAGNAIKTFIDIQGMDSFTMLLKQVKKSKNPKYEYLRQKASVEGAKL